MLGIFYLLSIILLSETETFPKRGTILTRMRDYKKIMLLTICFSFLIFNDVKATKIAVSYLLKECETIVLGTIKEIKAQEEIQDYRIEKQKRGYYYPHNEIRTIYKCEAVVSVEKYITGTGLDTITFSGSNQTKPDACFSGYGQLEIKQGERGYFFFNCKDCYRVNVIKQNEKDWKKTDKAIKDYERSR